MQIALDSTERDALFVHLVFVVVCAAVLLLPVTLLLGPRLLLLVLVYNVMIPVVGYWRKHWDWLRLWLFVFPISLLMVFPDWYLAAQLGVLVFPPDGLPKIGAVSLCMVGLWAVPLFIILFLGERLQERRSVLVAYGAVAVASFLIFVGAEAAMAPVWHAQNVFMVGGVALYIIVPEILLGLFAFATYATVKTQPYWRILLGSFVVMVLYLGSASLFYFLIDGIILGV